MIDRGLGVERIGICRLRQGLWMESERQDSEDVQQHMLASH